MSESEQLPLGILAFCERCGAACRTAKKDPTARLLRKSETPDDGYCLECAVTEFLQTTPPICFLFGKGDAIDKGEADYCRRTGFDTDFQGEKRGPAILMELPVRAMMQKVFEAGRAQATERAINWAKVIEMWDLPLVTRRRRKKGGAP